MSLIRHLFKLWPDPALLIRLGILQAIMAVLQGLLLGLLVPILPALLKPEPDFAAATPWLAAGAAGLVLYGVLSVIATPVGFAASGELAAQLRLHLMQHVSVLPLGWFTTERKARLALAVTALARARWRQIVTAALVILMGITVATQALTPENPPWRNIAAWVRTQAQPGDFAIFIPSFH